MNAKLFFTLLLASIAPSAFSQEKNDAAGKEPSWLHNKAERVAAFRSSHRPADSQPPAEKNPELAWITDRSAVKTSLPGAAAPKTAEAARKGQPGTELPSSSPAKEAEIKTAAPAGIESIMPASTLEQIRLKPVEKESMKKP